MGVKNKRELILHGNLKKAILLVSLPIMLNNLIQTLYNLIDTFWVSKLGKLDLSAISLVWPLSFFMISLGLGFSIAGGTFVAQYIGAKDYENAKKTIGQLLVLSVIVSGVIGVIGYFASPAILSLYDISPETMAKSVGYIRIIFIGMPTMFLMFFFESVKRGEGDTVTPMLFNLVSVTLNIILDPIFIFVFGWGIKGAAIATVLSRGIIVIIAVSTLFKKGHLKIDKEDLKLNSEDVIKLIKVGVPSSLGRSVSALGFMVLNGFIVGFGEHILNAFSIGNRINSLVLMPAMGVGNAIAAVIGQNLGNDNVKRAKKAIIESVKICTIFMIIGGMLLIPFAEDVVRIFSKDMQTVEPAVFYLKLICFSLPLVGYFQILIGIFQGSGHTLSAMVLMIGRLWFFRIPLIFILRNFTFLGEKAIWYAMISSNLFVCILGLVIFSTGRWQKKIIKGKKREEVKVSS